MTTPIPEDVMKAADQAVASWVQCINARPGNVATITTSIARALLAVQQAERERIKARAREIAEAVLVAAGSKLAYYEAHTRDRIVEAAAQAIAETAPVSDTTPPAISGDPA